MSLSPVTMTIDLAAKSIAITGVLAIREHVQVYLVNIGGSVPANLVLALNNGETVIASCSTFATVGSDVTGELLLTGTAALALFDDSDSPTGTKDLSLTLWDTSLKALRIADDVSVMNNTYLTTLTAPTAL